MALNLVCFSCFLGLLGAAFAPAGGYGGYGLEPELYKPNITPKKLLSSTVGIQGLIFCTSGPKLIPLQGAQARITCLAVDESGYESAPFSILSYPTNAKGYFLATLSPSELQKCKEAERVQGLPSKICRGVV
ncbi:hypothetical protein NMG60_11016974 [Bertholletia excelsa]